MTVEVGAVRQIYLGNGLIREWDIPFHLSDADFLRLFRSDKDGRIEAVDDLEYLVDLARQKVTFPLEPLPVLAAGEKMMLLRSTPITQNLNLENKGAFYPVLFEGALDHLTMICQELRDEMGRAVMVPEMDPNPDGFSQTILEARDQATKARDEAVESAEKIKDSVEASEESARKAAVSEGNAKESEVASASSASGSHRKASEAAQSAADARAARDVAQLYSSDAENSKLNAEVAEGNAEDSARRALEYKQATESFKNQAKQSAESVGAVVQEATDQADRAEREANRSESEADRAERAAREAEGIAGGGVTSLNGVHGAITLQAVGASLSQEDNTLTITVDIPEVESPVTSVNDKKGAVTISLDDLGGAKKIHTHDIDNIANLATLLDSLHDLIEGKANKNHTHSIEQIANLATALGDLQDAIDAARFPYQVVMEDEFDAITIKNSNTFYFVKE